MKGVLLLLLAWPCLVHASDAITPDGGLYFGPLRDGKLHGRGRIEWADGRSYRGEFALLNQRPLLDRAIAEHLQRWQEQRKKR